MPSNDIRELNGAGAENKGLRAHLARWFAEAFVNARLARYVATEEETWKSDCNDVTNIVWLLRAKHEGARSNASTSGRLGLGMLLVGIAAFVFAGNVVLAGWHRVLDLRRSTAGGS